jgi:hypothetical protein
MRDRKVSLGCVRATPSMAREGVRYQEHRQMWFYVQMWFPLLTIALTAAICLSVVSFIRGQAKPHP